MIVRNPYSFIARHYKIINLLLLIPIIYLLLIFGDIAEFFKNYVAQGYATAETNFSDTYVTSLSMVAVIFMIIVNAFLYIVFASKKKNNFIFGFNTIYFIVLLVGLFLFHTSMTSIETNKFSPTFANFVRDCASIGYLPLYLIIAYNATRIFGFNFKTLQFDNNADLKIREDEDENDIEIKIGNGNNSTKKTFVKTFRELKYYILENKFVFTIIGGILVLIVGYTTYQNYKLYNKTYTINQAFNLDNFTLALKDSYITDTDYRGNIVTEGKYYLVVRVGLQYNGKTPVSIDDSKFRIYDGNDVFYPKYDKSSRFIDVGEAYQGELIHKDDAHDYVFAYELTEKQIKTTYQLRILNHISQKNDKMLTSFRKITVKPRNITSTKDLGVLKLGQELKLKDTTLGNTKLTIDKVDIVPSYNYEYEKCNSKNVCTTIKDTIIPSKGHVLLIIKDHINLDETVPYNKYQYQDFYIDFSSLIYQFNIASGRDAGKKIRTTSLTNITPIILQGKVKIYEVPNTMYSAEKINLEIRIRNKYLTVVVRE